MVEPDDNKARNPPPSIIPSTGAENTTPEPDFSAYSWKNFFKAVAGTLSYDDAMKYLEARDTLKVEQDCKRCESDRDWLLKNSPIVTFMQQQIALLGGDLNPTNIRCRRCPTHKKGGFSEDYGILLCANKIKARGEMEDTIAHEMVHAYDHLRFKVERWNLRHQACTEIRASTLSGECRFTREFFTKGQWKLSSHLQTCVKRRAAISLLARPGVRDDVHAAKLVNEVWDSCFGDTRPFDEIYR
ncbi:hypothetical protein M501DRAFT_997378 [Patellaria atrata CBS 101060]|uniref:Mitochondrial inner membrane protease ATP23 n=1 Tax=Patellaria atrata CBS 101060 TaxID=1346257 RepID=A0A9P4S4Q4_9PEZI|nr:hypothetical protein M501DRAFT_997378 [Patellaria atrata CBS 101060]